MTMTQIRLGSSHPSLEMTNINTSEISIMVNSRITSDRAFSLVVAVAIQQIQILDPCRKSSSPQLQWTRRLLPEI